VGLEAEGTGWLVTNLKPASLGGPLRWAAAVKIQRGVSLNERSRKTLQGKGYRESVKGASRMGYAHGKLGPESMRKHAREDL